MLTSSTDNFTFESTSTGTGYYHEHYDVTMDSNFSTTSESLEELELEQVTQYMESSNETENWQFSNETEALSAG